MFVSCLCNLFTFANPVSPVQLFQDLLKELGVGQRDIWILVRYVKGVPQWQKHVLWVLYVDKWHAWLDLKKGGKVIWRELTWELSRKNGKLYLFWAGADRECSFSQDKPAKLQPTNLQLRF